MKTSLSKLSPLLFTIFGSIMLGIPTYRHFFLSTATISELVPQALAVISYLLYMSFESKISIKEIGKVDSQRYDKNTMEIAAIIKISLLTACVLFGNTLVAERYKIANAIFSLILLYLGFFIRGKSIINLGSLYGHRIRPLGNVIYENGIYSYIRHGAYTGTFIFHLGLTLLFLNNVSIILILAWLGIVITRIQLEEAVLKKDIRYQKYCLKTKYKMIPGVW